LDPDRQNVSFYGKTIVLPFSQNMFHVIGLLQFVSGLKCLYVGKNNSFESSLEAPSTRPTTI
jgi:hypothetical protein